MSNSNAQPRKRSSGRSEVKTLFLSLSVTSILGLWVLFSRQGGLVDTKAESANSELIALPQTSSESMDGLPPIPTLVPLYTGSPAAGGDPGLVGAPAITFVAPPAVAPPSSTTLGDSRLPPKPPKPRPSKPVTSTRSSK